VKTAKKDKELDRITNEIRRLLAEANTLRRRTYLTDAAVGAQLILAKDRVPRGQWLPWLRANFDLSEDSAQLFMRVFRQSREEPLPDRPMTTNAFLSRYKQLRIDARQESREEERQRAAELAGQDPGRFKVHHADNRKFRWPGCWG
jgi:hypothetical protein